MLPQNKVETLDGLPKSEWQRSYENEDDIDAVNDRARRVDDVGMLLLEVTANNPAAFRNLYEATSSRLFTVLLRLLRDRDAAEDALQDVYLKVWLSAYHYDAARGSGLSWLIAISRNHALSRLRSRRYAHTSDQAILDALPDHHKGPEARMIISDDARWFLATLPRLTPEMASAVQDVCIYDLTYSELAQRHSVPINTIRTRLRRARLKLKNIYDLGPP